MVVVKISTINSFKTRFEDWVFCHRCVLFMLSKVVLCLVKHVLFNGRVKNLMFDRLLMGNTWLC